MLKQFRVLAPPVAKFYIFMNHKKQSKTSEFNEIIQSIEDANKTMTDNLNYVLKTIEKKIALIPEGDPVKAQLNQFINKAKK